MKSEFLTKWRTRDVDGLLRSMARYTRFVLLGKFFLVAVAVSLITLLVSFPLSNKDGGGVRVMFSAVEKAENVKPVMVNPKFQGLDKDNNPYTITAKSAMQEEKNVISLEGIQADMGLSAGQNWMLVTADTGTIRIDSKNVELVGNVSAYYGKGYEIHTEWITVDMNKGEAFGDQPLQAQGPAGVLKAKGFKALEKGDRLLFTGPVNLLLYPGGEKL